MKTRYPLLLLAGLLLCCRMIGGSIGPAPNPLDLHHGIGTSWSDGCNQHTCLTEDCSIQSSTAMYCGPTPPVIASETLLPLEPVTKSFAKFESANLRAASADTAFTPDFCGPDPRTCKGTLTIPMSCLHPCEGQVLHIRRPELPSFAADCTIRGPKCAVDIDTSRISYGRQWITFTYRNDAGDLSGAFELFTVGIR